MKARFGLCGIFVAAAAAVELASPGQAPAQRQSVIVENRDGSGTTIVKVFEDIQQEWTISNIWPTNQANGVVREADGSTVNISCNPTHRTNQEFTLDCFPYDSAGQQWSPVPIVTTVGADFLNGPYVNDYNSLFALPGEYVTILEFPPDVSQSYRIRFLDAAENTAGVLFLVGQTLPETRVAFLFRNTDLPDGTGELTNFTLGMQTDDFCIDMDLIPTEPGRSLAGTFGVRELEEGGTCGALVTENRSATLIPSGGSGVAGTYCRYIVEQVGECVPAGALSAGDAICLPCGGLCRDFTEDLDVAFASGAEYSLCDNIVVGEPELDCSPECEGLKSIGILRGD
jgi:hypothetical protein